MKNLLILFISSSIILAANTVYAENWLIGTYINQDKENLVDDAIFCEEGKVFLGGIARGTYTIETKDKEEHITLISNGTFNFKVSSDRSELIPTDDFTKSWFTKSSLKLDPAKKDTCNW